jgi:DNA end-binding protein Ku
LAVRSNFRRISVANSNPNKATGNRVNRVFIDSETEERVEKEAQTKGFEIENGQYIIIDPVEVSAAIPESNKTLEIEAFIPCSDVDDVHFDKPYYLTPDKLGGDAFAALRDGMDAILKSKRTS